MVLLLACDGKEPDNSDDTAEPTGFDCALVDPMVLETVEDVEAALSYASPQILTLTTADYVMQQVYRDPNGDGCPTLVTESCGWSVVGDCMDAAGILFSGSMLAAWCDGRITYTDYSYQDATNGEYFAADGYWEGGAGHYADHLSYEMLFDGWQVGRRSYELETTYLDSWGSVTNGYLWIESSDSGPTGDLCVSTALDGASFGAIDLVGTRVARIEHDSANDGCRSVTIAGRYVGEICDE